MKNYLENDEPDYETQLAVSVYLKLKEILGSGTFSRLQRIIREFPCTERVTNTRINPLDDDD